MLEGFSRLTSLDIIYAALMAFVITHFILSLDRLRRTTARMKAKTHPASEEERRAIINQCRSMFPVGTVNFRGKVFTTGMKVRITTLQKRIIEGEIIGKNDKDVLCVITGQHIIAHEINKIEDMTELANIFTDKKA